MIGYPHTLQDLRDGIQASVPGWLERAATRTTECELAGEHVGSPFWSEVKNYYRLLQGKSKCAFCERKLPAGQVGGYEHDIEHFRPKGNVKRWPAPSSLEGIACAEPPEPNCGFYLLAYHPLNYSVACKTCHEGLKKDFFPIEGEYVLDAKSPPGVTTEKPLLIYPLSPTGDKPEDLIVFDGPFPIPAKARGYANRRARVTIAFFRLADVEAREDLIIERCNVIIALKMLLEIIAGDSSDADKAEAQELVTAYTSDKAPHSNCARCYRALYLADLDSALIVFHNARQTVTRSS